MANKKYKIYINIIGGGTYEKADNLISTVYR